VLHHAEREAPPEVEQLVTLVRMSLECQAFKLPLMTSLL